MADGNLSDSEWEDNSCSSEAGSPDLLVSLVPRWVWEKIRPQVTVTNIGIIILLSSLVLPDAMTYMLFYPVFRLLFGTLYPAYASYKAVRTKNVKEYVKWMMYWIVFALFTCAETFTDVFLSFWFPFYYEIKIILVVWLLSPATKGSSILYRKFVHPMLSRREQEIDEYIAKAKEQGYHTVLHLGTKGVNYATTVLMQTAIKGGGGLVNQLRRSYSLSDLSSDKDDVNRNNNALQNVPDEDDMEETDGLDPRMLRPRGYSPRRSASGSGRVEMYFPEVDVDVRQHGTSRPREPSIPLSHIRSSEDVSSGYSSAEPLYAGHHQTKSEGLAASREPLIRTASVGSTRSMRTKSSRGGVVAKRGPAAEDDLFDLPGEEGDHGYYNNKEDLIYDRSSSLSPQPGIKRINSRPNTPLSSVPEVPPSDPTPNHIANNEQFVDATDSKPEEEGDDLPLYDAETDEAKNQSNDFSQSPKHDATSESKNLTESALSIATVPHPFTPSELATEPPLQNSNSVAITSAEVTQENQKQELKQNENIATVSSETQKTDTTVRNSISENENFAPQSSETKVESAPNQNDSTLQANIQEKESFAPQISETKVVSAVNQNDLTQTLQAIIQEMECFPPQISETKVESAPNQNDSAQTLQASIQEKESFAPQSSETKVESAPNQNDSTQTLQANTQEKESFAPQISETKEIESAQNQDYPTQTAQTIVKEEESSSSVSKVEDSSYSETIQSISSDELSTVAPSLADESISESQPATATSPASVLSAESLSLDISATVKQTSGSASASVESLVIPEPASRSNSQSSLRGGRYHKPPAPTPPPKTPEIESDSQETSSPALERKDLSEDTTTGSDDSEAPVTTARLVLKPGVVKTLGPDTTKAEVFVSKTPAKNKKTKSKHKQKESGLSRFFGKSQFGSLTSLIPFWHGKQEPSTSTPGASGSSGRTQAPLADSE